MSNLPTIVRKEIDDSHYYWVDGVFMPSVTRILDEAAPKEYGLLNWFKNNTPEDIEATSNAAKKKGTAVHDACEQLLNGIEIRLADYPVESKKLIARFYDWYKLYQPKNYQTEQTVASVSNKFAGTLDFIGELNGKKVLIDFKTNKSAVYFSNKLQIMAYKHAYEEMYEEKIDECYILRLGSQHKAGYEFKLIDDVTFDDFLNIYETYLRMHGGIIPEPPTVEAYPETLKLEIISLKK